MKAWQRQIRERESLVDEHTLFPTRPETIDIGRATIRKVGFETANTIIVRYEWLGTMATSTEHYGIFFDGFCGGVVCFGQCDGWTHRTVIKYGVPLSKTWVLSRGACVYWAHPHSASKLISTALRMLRRDTGAEVVIAYSDIEAGEIGTVYQSTNWIHLGVLRRNAEGFIDPDGKRYHRNVIYDTKRSIGSSKTWSQQKRELIGSGWTTYKIPDKRRYVYPLKKKWRDIISKDSKPYPKRSAGEVSSEIRHGSNVEGLGQFQAPAQSPHP